jgi:hypothetical protein
MRRLLGTLVIVCVAAFSPVAATPGAHFAGYVATVALPGGDSGAIRMLHDGGGSSAERVRIVVTDKRGDVRALGPVGSAAEFSCSGSRCSIYVYDDASMLPAVYRFQPSSTKSADATAAVDSSDLNAVMNSELIYGFVPVDGLLQRIWGALLCLTQWWPSFLALTTIGACLLLAGIRLWRAVVAARGGWSAAAVAGVVRSGGLVAAAVALYGLYVWASGYPPLLSAAAVSVPAVVVFAVQALLRRVDAGTAAAPPDDPADESREPALSAVPSGPRAA